MNKRRLERLEWQHAYRLAAEAGRPYGLTPEDVLGEARRLLALSDEAQRAELDARSATLDPEEAQTLEALRAPPGRMGRRGGPRRRGNRSPAGPHHGVAGMPMHPRDPLHPREMTPDAL